MMTRCTIGVSAVGLTLLTLGSVLLMRAPVQGQDTGARKRVLVLTHNAFYKHDMLETLERTVAELGEQGGFEVTSLEGYRQESDQLDLSTISAAYLSQFDGLLLATNGELPLDDGQRQALVDFVRNGKGLVAVHNTALTLYTYPPFGEMVGGYFWNTFNGYARDQRRIVLNVEDRTHPATRMLEPSWELLDEYYQMAPEAWDASRPDLYVGPDRPRCTARLLARPCPDADQPRYERDGYERPAAGVGARWRLSAGVVPAVRTRSLVVHVARPSGRAVDEQYAVPGPHSRRHPVVAGVGELAALFSPAFCCGRRSSHPPGRSRAAGAG